VTVVSKERYEYCPDITTIPGDQHSLRHLPILHMPFGEF